MKLLHTADWQIGMRAAHAGARAADVREARLGAAEEVVALAGRLRADALLLAGDTFEDSDVEPKLVRRVAELLARAACPVFILPGNHDPLGPGSIWSHAAWRDVAAKVRVFSTATPVELGDAVFLPAPIFSRASSEDPTLAIPRVDGAKIRIGVAHGSLRGQGFEPAADDFPIAPNAAERAGVDYLALGHWHSTLILPSENAARLAYPGTHETTKFGERMSGRALEVELEAGKPGRVTVHATGRLAWIDRAVELTDDESVTRLRAELDALERPERTLVRLRLSGLLGREGFAALAELAEAAETRFLSARIESEAVAPRPDSAAGWLAALPDGVARRVGEKLLAGAADSPVAREALAKLVQLSRKASAS
jgi:DNA repair exonuclease SbcCD nuclease subunit